MGLVLCLASLFTPLLSKTQTLEPGQIYTTGNIVQNTPQGGPTPWVGGVYQDNLTCWSGGDPGYCGPQAIVRAGNVINFSYGSTYLYQQQHISTILPSATGLQVTGYNFGFTAKNGNGWDDGRVDNLTALVRFWDNTGSKGATNLLYGTSYDLNRKFNWTPFNFSENFTSPLSVPSIGQVQYGFIGKDNNGWAGPYGPEIIDVKFSLKYKVDPCASNVLSSPTCPGYLDALAKLAPKTVASTTTETSPVVTASIEESAALTPTGTYGGVSPASQTGTSQPGSPPAPEAPPQQSGPTPPGPPTPGPTQLASASQPSANNPQPKIGEVSDSSGASKSSSPVSLSSVLSMISSNQEKTSALEKSIVQAADAQAFSAGETAKQQAEKIAGDAQSQSIANSGSSQTTGQSSVGQSSVMQMQGSVSALQGNLQSNTMANTARLQQSINSSTIALIDNAAQNVTGYQQNMFQQTTRQEFNVSIATPTVSYSLSTPSRYIPQATIESPTVDGIKFGGFKGPVDSAMESKSVQPDTNDNQQQASSVNKNVQNNDAAGNVTIESMATQPQGYAAYSFTLADAQFYTPKEIYKNQNNVDNARALRQLGSDKLHQQMVDQQYR